jgi:hypothetical protein
VEGDLLCPLRPKTSSRRALVNIAEGAIGMEHSIDAFCVLLVSAIERTPQSAAAQALQA